MKPDTKKKIIYAILVDSKGWSHRMKIPYVMERIRYPKKVKQVNCFIDDTRGMWELPDKRMESVEFIRDYHTEDDNNCIYIYYREIEG